MRYVNTKSKLLAGFINNLSKSKLFRRWFYSYFYYTTQNFHDDYVRITIIRIRKIKINDEKIIDNFSSYYIYK